MKKHWTQLPENREKLRRVQAMRHVRTKAVSPGSVSGFLENIEAELKASAHAAVEQMDTATLNRTVARLQSLEDVKRQAQALLNGAAEHSELVAAPERELAAVA